MLKLSCLSPFRVFVLVFFSLALGRAHASIACNEALVSPAGIW